MSSEEYVVFGVVLFLWELVPTTFVVLFFRAPPRRLPGWAAGRCCRGAGERWKGSRGEAERYLRRPRSRLEISGEGEREEKALANPAGEAGPAGGPRSSSTAGRLARASP